MAASRRPSISDGRMRHPLLDEAGDRLLRWMTEHASAPRWNYACGDQLDAAGLESVRAFERLPVASWRPGERPSFIGDLVDRCLAEVPFYRRLHALRFEDVPLTTRHDVLREPWAFVEDGHPLDDMLVYDTSGTVGTKMLVMADPIVASSYLPLLRRALSWHGVDLQGGAGRVSLVLVGDQASTLTYATVSSFLDGAGFVKVNLNPAEWRLPEDRVAFLDSLAPEVYSGDPLALESLSALPLTTRPKALVSSAMTLLPGMRARLAAFGGIPVVDVYSLTECRFLAASIDGSHRLVRPDVYVETVDGAGLPTPYGVRGELIISGGNNPFLRLLRYRTGDFGVIRHAHDGIYIDGLEGRSPVVFTAADGRDVNNIDVTYALRDLALTRFSLHQSADGSFRFRYAGPADAAEVARALEALLGPVDVGPDEAPPGAKLISYTRDK